MKRTKYEQFQPQTGKNKIRSAEADLKFTVSYKKSDRICSLHHTSNISIINHK